MARDFVNSLKVLLAQLQEGEKNASDLLKGLNIWAREVGDLIKDKVEEEVERSVKKMGFVKKEQFASLEARVRTLEKSKQGSRGSKPQRASSPAPVLRKKKKTAKVAKKKAPAKGGKR